jgi:hypothetical protein
MLEFGYAEVERVLAELHRIADDKRTAFRARLKHFQRLGFPEGANTGTGKRAVYSSDMLLQLVMAVELVQCGLPPKTIVRLLNDNWETTRRALMYAMTPDEKFEELPRYYDSPDLMWTIRPEALRDLSSDGENEFDFMEAVSVESVESLSAFFVRQRDYGVIVGESHRHIVIQLRELVAKLLYAVMNEVSREAARGILSDLLEHEAIEWQERKDFSNQLSKALDDGS